jgi:hypothetical protein
MSSNSHDNGGMAKPVIHLGKAISDVHSAANAALGPISGSPLGMAIEHLEKLSATAVQADTMENPDSNSLWRPNLGRVDPVNNPPHYTSHPSGIECIQITEHMGFNLGNAIKYIWRADLKDNAVEDLEKARWYIDREIKKRIAGVSIAKDQHAIPTAGDSEEHY